MEAEYITIGDQSRSDEFCINTLKDGIDIGHREEIHATSSRHLPRCYKSAIEDIRSAYIPFVPKLTIDAIVYASVTIGIGELENNTNVKFLQGLLVTLKEKGYGDTEEFYDFERDGIEFDSSDSHAGSIRITDKRQSSVYNLASSIGIDKTYLLAMATTIGINILLNSTDEKIRPGVKECIDRIVKRFYGLIERNYVLISVKFRPYKLTENGLIWTDTEFSTKEQECTYVSTKEQDCTNISTLVHPQASKYYNIDKNESFNGQKSASTNPDDNSSIIPIGLKENHMKYKPKDCTNEFTRDETRPW